MTTRTRVRLRYFDPGTVETYVNGSLVNQSNASPNFSGFDVCTDEGDRPKVAKSLEIETADFSGVPPLSGHLSGTGQFDGTGMTNWSPDWRIPFRNHLGTDMDSRPAATYITDLIARTNPSRPGVNPATLAQDIFELPAMLTHIKDLFKNPKQLKISRYQAKAYVGLQFGWLPLVQDINQLLNIQRSIHFRIAELHKLYESGEGLRRRINLGSAHSESQVYNYTLGSGTGLDYRVDISRFTTAERWGTVRWIPTSLPAFDPNTPRFNQFATQLVQGFTPDALTQGAWDLLPWSWLVGWFTNLGNFTQTVSQSVPAVPTNACVMTHYKTVNVLRRVDGSTHLKGGSGTITYETKSRVTGGASIDAFIPFIGYDKLSILLALNIQRLRRSAIF